MNMLSYSRLEKDTSDMFFLDWRFCWIYSFPDANTL